MAEPRSTGGLRELPLREVVSALAAKASELARAEVALAKAEVRQDVRTELRMASGLGIAGVCAILTLALLLVAVVFAFAESGTLPGWAAALLVAGVVLAIGTVAGLVGWAKRVKTPLDSTRRSLTESVKWVKERIA
jgi:uncharacterized membrane protein YqjE